MKLDLHPSINGYVGKLNVSEDLAKSNKDGDGYTMIIILDRSGSMGQNVNRVVTNVLPRFLELVNYPIEKKITLITFDSQTNVYKMNRDELKNSRMNCQGCTYMERSIKELENIIINSDNNRFRILTISDGVLHDQQNTVSAASKMVSTIKDKYTINSQAIRLFTSSSQPDTRGLASVLQFNNVTDCRLVDINSDGLVPCVNIFNPSKTFSGSAPIIASLFDNDGVDYSIKLSVSNKCVMTTPYSEAKDDVNLKVGMNTLWFKDLPTNMSINGTSVDIEIKESLSSENYSDILGSELENFVNKMKVLKVVGTSESKEEIQQMIAYFSDLEKWLDSTEASTIELLKNTSLNGRLKYFKNLINRRKKSFFHVLLQIANDDRVSKLNSAQQADYLRDTDITRLGKSLAKRAEKFGLDFTSTLHKEVINISRNIEELKDIDDSSHHVSFYSQDTTLGGLRALAELVDEDLLNDMDANDILQMSNIVGVSCEATVGDYPDPMPWRVDNIYPGCYVSVSDIMMAHLQSGGKQLVPPGFPDNKITNVIPIFDDQRICKFMRKYCPTMLEYNASVGMRRVITGIATTNLYTICGGLWKMIEILDTNKSELNILTFEELATTYDWYVGNFFQHILEYIKEQDSNLSYYIGNNGLTNMIHPIYKLIKNKDTQHLHKIMRSIYSFESAQMMKKHIRHIDGFANPNIIKETLNKLLGVDFETHGLSATPVFVENYNKPTFYKQYNINDDELKRLCDHFWFADYCTLIPAFFEGLNDSDPVEYIRTFEKMNDSFKEAMFGIDYDMKKFKLYTVVQSLLHPTKTDRVDDEKNQMKIVDIGNKHLAEKMITDYVEQQYKVYYYNQIISKTKKEYEAMYAKLVDQMLFSKDFSEYISLFKNGLTYGDKTFKIENSSSAGYMDLHNCLLDTTIQIPDRFNKIRVMLLGCDWDNLPVWNNGGVLFTKLHEIEPIFRNAGEDALWDKIYEIYKERNLHIYRGGDSKKNRHGHSNDLPSYWAYGYQSIEEFMANITLEQWEEYKSLHIGCCGL